MSIPRPFRLLGVQQIAIGAADKSRLQAFWVQLLGIQQTGQFISETENVDEDICQVGMGPFAVEIDLMQPLNSSKKPRVDSPALNHIGFWVDDLKAAHAWLTEQGLRFTPGGIRQGAAGHDVCFIHPKGSEDFPLCAEGVLVELVQAPSCVVDAYEGQSQIASS